MKVTLARDKVDRLVEQGTTNVEAYQFYLQGRALLNRRGASIQPGSTCSEGGRGDPDYALAWAGIADALTVLAYSGAARARVETTGEGGGEKVNRDRSHIGGRTHRLACATLLHENNRALPRREFERAWSSIRVPLGRPGTPSSISSGRAGTSSGASRSPPRARQRSAVGVRHDEPLCCCSRQASRTRRCDGSAGRQRDPESFVARWTWAWRSEWPDDTRRRSRRSRLPHGCRRARARPHRPGGGHLGRGGSRRRRSPCIAN